MLKVIKKNSTDEFEGLDKVFEDCIDFVREQIYENIYDRKDTNVAKDIGDAFNLLNSIVITNLRDSPIFFELINGNKLPLEERKQLAQISFNQFLRGLNFGFEEAILKEIKEITTH